MQETLETWVQSLGWEDPQEEMAAQSSMLVERIPWTEELDGLQSKESDMTEWLSMHTSTIISQYAR